jgi:DNA-binding beta-propeller fold protein YncE
MEQKYNLEILGYDNVSVIYPTTTTVTATVNVGSLSYTQGVAVPADRTKLCVKNDVVNSVFLISMD